MKYNLILTFMLLIGLTYISFEYKLITAGENFIAGILILIYFQLLQIKDKLK